MIKAIVFDMDDTLVRTSEIKYKAHKHTAKKFYNLDFTDTYIRSHWGKPFNKMMEEMYGPVDSVEKIIANFYQETDKFPNAAYDDAKTIVKKLAKTRRLGILTAVNTYLMQGALADAGYDLQLFTYIQTSDDTTIHKPDPGVFLPTIKHFQSLGITKEEMLYVGDSVSDFQASSGAGIAFIGIAGRTTTKEVFDRHGAKTITDFTKLEAYL